MILMRFYLQQKKRVDKIEHHIPAGRSLKLDRIEHYMAAT